MKKRNGFTIVELVIVLAIMGIMSAIAIPSIAIAVQITEERDLQVLLQDGYNDYAVDAADGVSDENNAHLPYYQRDEVVNVHDDKKYIYVDNEWSLDSSVTIGESGKLGYYNFCTIYIKK